MKEHSVILDFVVIEDDYFFKITNQNYIREFFMSIVSDCDHWMFISSNGGITAGRKNSEFAIFPYYTDDVISNNCENTGSKTIIKVLENNHYKIWEPFSIRSEHQYNVKRNLYKSFYGNKIIFEEINEDLEISYQYMWCNSESFGFIKKATLSSFSKTEKKIEILDGLQNILPANVNSDLQRASSNLVDAYKRNELHHKTGLGIFSLSAFIVDKAEPSESLKANTVWSYGLKPTHYLLSNLQLENFRQHNSITTELDCKGEKGSYYITEKINLTPKESKNWAFIINVDQGHASIYNLIKRLSNATSLYLEVERDIQKGTDNLKKLVAGADAFQKTSDVLNDARHYSNVLFNLMRGGIFDDGYKIEKKDFTKYLKKANQKVCNHNESFLSSLPEYFSYTLLVEKANRLDDIDFQRLATEYLPLKFSRRHGDPSRPWNKFSINIKDNATGEKILDYEGNWRDIFQNWEALAHSYPAYIEGMLYKFLNASTFDGYNPYRVTKDGFDWETIEEDDPWSYIGYWGDHQIIYLLKFLEFIKAYYPEKLALLFEKENFVYAAVPYKIKTIEAILKNPKDTIDFDHSWDAEIRTNRVNMGADGALLLDANNDIYHVQFIEKILATYLAKISNLIPDGGIWMNTQRPEWNDANNALVGNGISMVTLYYLRRFLMFFQETLKNCEPLQFKISNELVEYYHTTREIIAQYHPLLQGSINDMQRKEMMLQLGKAASDYRTQIYNNGFWGKKRTVSKEGILNCITQSLDFIENTIERNKRQDGLFHSYNLINLLNEEATIKHLPEMLEGQVAILSSGYLDANESLAVLDALKKSSLFREEQYSYILYPNKNLPGFLEKNNIPKEDINNSLLLKKLIENNNTSIIEVDDLGNYHFNGNFKNQSDLEKAILQLDEKYLPIDQNEKDKVLSIFETIFQHQSFTGRSGTFFAYEGLGSIYWHMVSKLSLAVAETITKSIEKNEDKVVIGKLFDHFYEIQAGIGVHKSPSLYGAFPTDPYSHTPLHKGAQQPGMTGQVKEDILSRWIELGVFIKDGCITFNPSILRKSEFITTTTTFEYISAENKLEMIEIPNESLFFTYCQVPIIYKISNTSQIEIHTKSEIQKINSKTLSKEISEAVFNRSGEVQLIIVYLIENQLNK